MHGEVGELTRSLTVGWDQVDLASFLALGFNADDLLALGALPCHPEDGSDLDLATFGVNGLLHDSFSLTS